MKVIRVLLFLIWCISVNSRYSLYHSDIRQSSYPTFDCLYAYMIDGGKENGKHYIQNYHLIPYCRRPDNDERDEQKDIPNKIAKNIAVAITFKELKKRNVTSEQLLRWYAPIDVVEKYEMNLNESDSFNNCSSPWFGSMCQYKFDFDVPLSFGEIVRATFADQQNMFSNVTSGTCYRFLPGCDYGRWPMCFDWREVCDGKRDCMNGEDELWCDQLETTECSHDEYRCHYGGQCIPLPFAKDSRVSIDCLDGSDEEEHYLAHTKSMNSFCPSISTFECQERIGRSLWSFQCGDGQYLIDSNLPIDRVICANKKDLEVSRAMLTSMDHIQNTDCQKAFYCALHFNRTFGSDPSNVLDILKPIPPTEEVGSEDCEALSQSCSSEWLVIPARPLLFGFFQFIYFTNRSVDEFKNNILPDFVCFNARSCPMLLEKIVSIEIIKGLTCCDPSNLTDVTEMKDFNDVVSYFYFYKHQCLKMGTEKSCRNSSYFHCNQSMKCISYHRVGDGSKDCLFGEDESFDTCQWNDSTRFKCQGDTNKCLSQVALGNGVDDCPSREDEIFSYTENLVILASFPHLCNHYKHRDIVSLEIMETDEIDCDWWPCDNPYTHCDRYWNCPNGADELNCPHTKCLFNEHECFQGQSGLSHCLPLAHMYDKYLDPCNDTFFLRQIYFYNGTRNISDSYFPWNQQQCITPEQMCRGSYDLPTSLNQKEICLYQSTELGLMYITPVKHFQDEESLCELELSTGNDDFDRLFTATRLGHHPKISTNISFPFISKIEPKERLVLNLTPALISYCHRGIAMRNGLHETIQCLCPPNYFGARCQWQSQRVSLTLQLLWHSTVSNTVIFQVIIMLIDEHGQIAANHEQITYIPTQHCSTKFNLYLLYPHRPKILSMNYSIRIDLYEKTKLDYWASWYLPIPFQFLPVNRIAALLPIPEVRQMEQCALSCGKHGKCMRYINKKFSFFCQCDQGYSGAHCNITYKCDCAEGSFCLDSSICICPLHKFGSYCYLNHSICHSLENPCQHNGLCVPTDVRITSTGFICLCQENYSGERCQDENNRIEIYLDETISSPNSVVFAHFITGFTNAEHERITVLKKLPFDTNVLTIYVTQPFHILFIQTVNQDYYLAVLRESFLPSEYIHTEIHIKQRCPSISELVNDTFAQYEYFRRTKYYPLLCRVQTQLMCFYDKDLMCVCDVDRFSNCFSFNHAMINDCQGYNYCENGGQCFQNNETCPTKLTCICEHCFYGSKCQFSTQAFIFSLDSILAYHVRAKTAVHRQPLIVKISIIISTIMIITGLTNGLISIVIFRRKKVRQVGTGYYLFISSITSILMIILLTMKFWLLIVSQMSFIDNRSWLYLNCVSLDVSLKVLLASSEWLNACVAIERTISVTQGVRFSKERSIEISKWVIVNVLLLVTLTHIHDPIYRRLVDDFDVDEHRIWCLVQYSFSVNIYNSFITFFHLLTPFLLNLISALWIIKTLAQNRTNAHHDQSFKQHLRQQIKEHRHLVLAPCLLILVSLPRVIISFISGCMRSTREPWLYLIGYFLSFIPAMLTSIVFVLPSENYKKEFVQTIQEARKRFNAAR